MLDLIDRVAEGGESCNRRCDSWPMDGAELNLVIQGSGEAVVVIYGSVLTDECALMAAEPDLSRRMRRSRP